MLSIFKDFLLNLFFILLPVFLVPFWTEQEKGPKRLRLYLPTVCYAIVIVLCITLPVGTGNSYIFDLRQIPLWLGSLYGGTGAAACLAIVTITYRTLFGGIGIFITAIVSIVIAAASSLLTKKFERLPTKQRILLTTTLSFGSGLLTVALTGGMAPSALPPAFSVTHVFACAASEHVHRLRFSRDGAPQYRAAQADHSC